MKRLLGLLVLSFLAFVPAAAQQGITPCAASTISASATSSNVQLSACGNTVLIWNVGTVEAFYSFGPTSSQTATTSNYSLPAGGYVVLRLSGQGQPYLAAVTSSSTTTIRITQGVTS